MSNSHTERVHSKDLENDSEKENKRYKIAYLSTPAFLLDINRIAETEGDTLLYIHCSEEELDQFHRPVD